MKLYLRKKALVIPNKAMQVLRQYLLTTRDLAKEQRQLAMTTNSFAQCHNPPIRVSINHPHPHPKLKLNSKLKLNLTLHHLNHLNRLYYSLLHYSYRCPSSLFFSFHYFPLSLFISFHFHSISFAILTLCELDFCSSAFAFAFKFVHAYSTLLYLLYLPYPTHLPHVMSWESLKICREIKRKPRDLIS